MLAAGTIITDRVEDSIVSDDLDHGTSQFSDSGSASCGSPHVIAVAGAIATVDDDTTVVVQGRPSPQAANEGGLAMFRRAANTVRAANQFKAAGAHQRSAAPLAHRPAAYSKYKQGAKLRYLARGSTKRATALYATK